MGQHDPAGSFSLSLRFPVTCLESHHTVMVLKAYQWLFNQQMFPRSSLWRDDGRLRGSSHLVSISPRLSVESTRDASPVSILREYSLPSDCRLS
jgi:hypothetical protein